MLEAQRLVEALDLLLDIHRLFGRHGRLLPLPAPSANEELADLVRLGHPQRPDGGGVDAHSDRESGEHRDELGAERGARGAASSPYQTP